ncbi:hypothetical protein Tco_0612752 [Tanacetum coccineum]
MVGRVVIDSQPLTVVVLASLLYGESIGLVGIAGLILGVVGLALLELKQDQRAHMFLEDGHICRWLNPMKDDVRR